MKTKWAEVLHYLRRWKSGVGGGVKTFFFAKCAENAGTVVKIMKFHENRNNNAHAGPSNVDISVIYIDFHEILSSSRCIHYFQQILQTKS